jgi:hypothetical protein
MKKILLTVAGSMLIALATVNAQERSDTTKTKDSSTEYRRSNESGTQAETGTIQGKSGTQGQMSWREEDRETITREDLPEALITTLEGDEYKGWENATIYRNRTNSNYMLVLDDNGAVKTFYFDKEGKAMEFGPMDAEPKDDATDQSAQYTAHDDKDAEARDDSDADSSSGSVSTSGNVSSSGNVTSTDVSTSGNVSNSTGVSGTASTTPTGNGVSVSAQVDQPQWRKEDKLKITTSQIPSGMLITLGDPMYKGWDKSVVYRNKSTNDYMMEITENGTTRTYYFDKSGSPIQSGSMSSQNTSGKTNDQSYNQPKAETGVSVQSGAGNTNVSGKVSTTDKDKSSATYRTENKDSQTQTTTSGAIGTSQVGDDKDAANQTDKNYGLNSASTQEPVQTEQPSVSWRNEDRVVVESRDIPASLRMTLDNDDQYKGWENSTVYQNRTSNDYMVEIRDGSESKSYYFDKEGKVKTDDNEGAGRSGYTNTEQKVKTGNAADSDTESSNRWRTEDRVMITSSEIPESLRSSLSDDKYKGWEKSTIYRNRSTNEYLIEIQDGDNVKTYYFDKNGKAMVLDNDED